jgi:hypothetical protein
MSAGASGQAGMGSDGDSATDPAVQAVDKISIVAIRRLNAFFIVQKYPADQRQVPSCFGKPHDQGSL